MSNFKVSWSDSTLAMFRVLRGAIQKYGFMNASLSLMLCVIMHQTFVMSNYFIANEISDDDLNCVIKKRFKLNCSKVNSKFKVRLPDDTKSCSYAVESSFVSNQLDSQLFEAYDFDGSVISLLLQSNLMEILMKTVVRAQKSEIELIEPMHIIATMFDEDCSDLREFFADLGLSYKEAKDYFVERYGLAPFVIPSEYSGILSILNDNVDITKPCEILKRDDEVRSCFDIMLKRDHHNPLIMSEVGWGKSALIEKITYDIVNNTFSTHFFGFTIVSLDVYALIDETERSLENVNNLIDFLTSRSDVIICIEKINQLVICQENTQKDILHILEPLWTSPNTIVIGTLTPLEYEKSFSEYDLSLNFEIVPIPMTYPQDMYNVLHSKIKALSDFHQVDVSEKIAKYALQMGCAFFGGDGCGLHSMVNLIDVSMSTAKRLFYNSLTREDILANCNLSYSIYDIIPEHRRWEIAIHEAGHYVTGKLSESLTTFTFLAISIIPCGESCGRTFSWQDYSAGTTETLDFCLDYMAFLIAGKEAEKAFDIKANSGSFSDLSKVTSYVFRTIEVLDLLEISHRNERYINATESLKLSKKTAKRINEKANELIDVATNRADRIIGKNKDVIRAIADALIKQPVMAAEEIDKVWQDTVSKRATAKAQDAKKHKSK